MVTQKTDAEVREMVREAYGRVAEGSGGCGCSSGSAAAGSVALKLGYREEDLQAVPEGANLGLGCGAPVAQAALKSGEVVVDLGSGAGFDVFLAAREVGPEGRVIGIDMTPEMLDKARKNAAKAGAENVEFRQGVIESLPLGDGVADAIISNCVINLSPDKPAVFREALRVLRPGGRLVVSDIALRGKLPPALSESIAAYTGCVSGALQLEDYTAGLREAGFQEVEILEQGGIDPATFEGDPVAQSLLSCCGGPESAVQQLAAVRHVILRARKPA
jgi:arsenite methyltransferase